MIGVICDLREAIHPFRTISDRLGDAMLMSNIKPLITMAINGCVQSNFEDEYQRASSLIYDLMSYCSENDDEAVLSKWLLMCNEIMEKFEHCGYTDYNEIIVIHVQDDDKVALRLC